MIDFINAVSWPFVALIFAIFGGVTIWIVSGLTARGAHEAREMAHREKMAQMPLTHGEALAKIKSNDPKMIEGIRN